MKKRLFLLFIFLPAFLAAGAEVRLPQILTSNMVLQQNRPLPIWGFADACEEVSVSFGGQLKKTRADASGRWEVVLSPLKASFSPRVMKISAENTILLKNILIGEVWLCSGQSNMAYSLSKSSKHAHAQRSSGPSEQALRKIKEPAIRVFLVKRSLLENNGANRGWEEAGFEAIKDFSAAGYFFAQKIHQALQVPVGIISSAVPGSPIERWVPEETLASEPGFKPEVPKSPEVTDGLDAGKFYYGMIQPLAPFAVAGFLWYQGETNCFKNEGFAYTDKMQALIKTWRNIWRKDNLPFYYVQIAPFYYSQSKGEYPLSETTLPCFREAQAAALSIPHTGMVVTTDLVDDLHDIHPSYKWEVGRRLALLALARSYGKEVVYSGPVFKGTKIKGNKVVVEFSHVGGGLVSTDGQPLTWFEVAGEAGNFVSAKAVIKKGRVVVSAPGVARPHDVRFAWDEAAQPNLFNSEGLPARPFRSNTPEWGPTNVEGGQKEIIQK